MIDGGYKVVWRKSLNAIFSSHVDMFWTFLNRTFKYGTLSRKFLFCQQSKIYIPFPSLFKCRETGQTSESIVGAALIPNPQVILPACTRYLVKTDIALKYLMCQRACVYTHRSESSYLCTYLCYLFSHLCLVTVSCSTERIIWLSCRIHICMKNDKFPLRSLQIKYSK